MGSAVAYHLARRGVRVLGLDRLVPPHAQGSSHGESRIIREAYFEHSLYVPLVRRALALWVELQEAHGEPLLRRTGALMVGPADGLLVNGAERSALSHEIAHRRMSSADAMRRFPFLKLPEDFELLHEPGAGVLAPEACISAHLTQARLHGAELNTGVTLIDWSSGPDGVVVRTDWKELETEHLILCTGSWLPAMVPQLPLVTERQVMIWFSPAAGGTPAWPRSGPTFMWETSEGELFYGIPNAAGALKAARHHGGAVGHGPHVDPEVRHEDVAPVRDFLERHSPGAAGEVLHTAVCRYTNTPTGHFYIAPLATEPLVHLVSACSGHGFKFASVIGEAVARRVLSEADELDLSAFGSASMA
jgi:sarcosine oxidase